MPGYALSVMLKYYLISYSEFEVIGCFLLVLFSFYLNVLIFTVALICRISLELMMHSLKKEKYRFKRPLTHWLTKKVRVCFN